MSGGKSDDGKASGFTVSDRRIFSPEAENPAPPAAGSAAAPADPETGASPAAADSETTGSSVQNLPPVDFHTFVLSLGSSALLHLGELEHPDGREAQPDLPLAKHTIDIIAMLQEKTRGNLSPPEERLIESLLYDLRLRYVEHTKSAH
jgi:hypothetical protein